MSAHTQWRVARVDYCKPYDETVDPPTSQKPTVFITYGYEYISAQCYPGSRCNLMLSDGVHHQYCIRNPSVKRKSRVRSNTSEIMYSKGSRADVGADVGPIPGRRGCGRGFLFWVR